MNNGSLSHVEGIVIPCLSERYPMWSVRKRNALKLMVAVLALRELSFLRYASFNDEYQPIGCVFPGVHLKDRSSLQPLTGVSNFFLGFASR